MTDDINNLLLKCDKPKQLLEQCQKSQTKVGFSFLYLESLLSTSVIFTVWPSYTYSHLLASNLNLYSLCNSSFNWPLSFHSRWHFPLHASFHVPQLLFFILILLVNRRVCCVMVRHVNTYKAWKDLGNFYHSIAGFFDYVNCWGCYGSIFYLKIFLGGHCLMKIKKGALDWICIPFIYN